MLLCHEFKEECISVDNMSSDWTLESVSGFST